MKKIIAVFDGLRFSESTLTYAIMLCKQNLAHLVGVFLNDVTYYSRNPYRVLADPDSGYSSLEALEEEDNTMRNAAIAKFTNACSAEGLNYSVHKDKYIALTELLHESIYADLLVIDADETFSRYSDVVPPPRFIRDLLADVQCPVLVAPHTYTPIRRAVLLYDGKPSSVYAIKMFNYLLPVLSALPVEVVTVKENPGNLHLPDGTLMKEFMKRHHPHATYQVLKGIPEEEIIAHLRKEDSQSVIVAGAYHRSGISRFFRNSMADVLLRDIKWPLFIAHQ